MKTSGLKAVLLAVLGSVLGVVGFTSVPPPCDPGITTEFPFEYKFVDVLDSHVAYVEEGEGQVIVLLHGNPTSSYEFRDVMSVLREYGRVIAPDLIGFGKSGKPDIDYTFADLIDYFEGFMNAMAHAKDVLFVGHDWGGAVIQDYAMRYEGNTRGIVLMETMMFPFPSRDILDPLTYEVFAGIRSEQGEELIYEQNFWVEYALPTGSNGCMDADSPQMDYYREPFLNASSRKPMLQLPRQVPIAGEPPEVVARMGMNYEMMKETDLPLLLLQFQPGSLMNQEVVDMIKQDLPQMTVKDIGPGIHSVLESTPFRIADAIVDWMKVTNLA